MGEPEKPDWLRIKPKTSDIFQKIRRMGRERGLHTVCDASLCPNILECWSKGHTTFMILGEVCTRSCRFCAVQSGDPGGKVDEEEPRRVAESVRDLGLRHAVITSVARDDLSDYGAGHFSRAIKEIKSLTPGTSIEVLVPDFQGREEAVESVVRAGPNVFAHNIETVREMQRDVRDRRSSYEASLNVLEKAKNSNPSMVIKSSLMVGLGETRAQILEALVDLRTVGTDLLTIGQYLRPRNGRLPLQRYVSPDEFQEMKDYGMRLGFKFIASGPFVRSSYMAEEAYLRSQDR